MRSELMEKHESGEHDLCQQQESVPILASICHNSQKEMTSFFFLSFAIYSRQSYKHTSDNIQSVTEILRTCECVRVLEVRV